MTDTITKDNDINKEESSSYVEYAALALKFAITYGIPAAIRIMTTLTNDKIDIERITKLSVTKTPREYFECLAGCVGDRDCDGVPDALDKCPDMGAPEGGCVTAEGCPDSDCDGVSDDVDKCPTDPNCQ